MSNEELVKLIQHGIDVNQNLSVLYEQNLGMIRKLARHYANTNNMEDLVQEAFFGIKYAVKMWSSEMGVPFIHYAIIAIRSYMLRYSNNDNNIKIPLMESSKLYELRKKYNTKSLDSVLYEDSDGNPVKLEDIIQDPNDPIEETIIEMESNELKSKLWELVDDLPERESTILHNIYEKDKSLKECSDELNVSCERCRQIKNNALRKMRDPVHKKALTPYMIDTIESYAYNKSGFGLYKHTNTSSVESAVIKLYNDK